MEKIYKFTQLEDVYSRPHVIFTYLGEETKEAITISISMNGCDGIDAGGLEVVLPIGDTSYDFDNLWLNTNYNYLLKKGFEVFGRGNFELTEKGLFLDGAIFDGSLSRANSYQAKSGSTNIGSATPSLWKAIENARSSAYTTATVEKNSTSTVFTKGTTTNYHKYQFENYYGSTTSSTDAQNWITGYNYSHIITNAAVPIYDYLQNIKGGLTGISSSSLIERNEGAYYYNFSTVSSSYKKITVEVNLASITARKASGSPYNNLYFFVAAKQSYTSEVGLIMGGNQSGSPTLYAYYKIGTSNNISTQNAIAVGSTTSGVMSFTGTVKITLGIAAGQMVCNVTNTTTGSSWSDTISDSSVSGSANTRWLYCASLVPDKASGAINDLRNYAYMRNAKFSNPTLYTTILATSGSSMAPSTSLCEYAFLYNTDCGSYSSSSGVETIEIFYDRDL